MLLRIARNSLRQYALSTAITSLSIGLAGALLLSVWVIKDEARTTFAQIDSGFDAVLGARSTKLQLVLNAIFHLEASPANIEMEDFQEIARNPNVALAVPIAMGDNYRGFRVVGTAPEMFTQVEYAEGKKHKVHAPGRLFDPTLREAVVGSFAAQKLRLKRGDHFHPYHGLNFCQGTVSEMLQDPGKEILDVIRHFGSRKKIFNVHFRNIKGKFLDFQETYIDNGDVDMLKAMRVYRDVGYDGMMMPDHVPSIEGDTGNAQGFAFTFGYIKALIAAVAAEA